MFEHFERLILLPAAAQDAQLSELHNANPVLAAELERLLLAESEANPLDDVADGGGQRLAAALSAFDAPDDCMPDVPGYRVLGVLGEGGMGRVFLGERDVQGYIQRVAIKRVRRDRATPIVRARFLIEQRHLAALDHPGICRFIEAGEMKDGSSFVVMEAVEGTELLTFCETAGLDPNQRVGLLRRLLDAVAHAHERLLIHRDLKPSNVLVTADGQPKLLDFGISKSLAAPDVDATATSDRYFTLSATAPEQLLGHSLGVGCDVYALGLLAYRLLSGKPAYELSALKPADAEAQILHRPPPPMSTGATVAWAARLRGDLDAVVLRCLRKAPSERYLNVREMDADLARWQRHLPISSRESELTYRSRLFIKRNLGRVFASVVLSLAGAVGAAGFWMQAREVASQRAQAIEERDRAVLLSQILEDAFIQSDPARAGGEGVSVRTILDAVKARLETLESSNPRLFASLAASVAKVEMGLGADSIAADLSARGLQALADIEGEDPLRMELRAVAAESLSRAGRLPEAQLMLDQAFAQGGGAGWAWQYATARYELDTRRFADSEARLRQMLANAADGTARQVLEAKRLLVESLVLSGAVLEAIQIQRDLHAHALASRGADHPSVPLEELELLRLQTHLSPASAGLSPQFDRVLAALIEHYGIHSPIVAGGHAAAARAYFNEGLKERAIDALRQAAESFRAALGDGHIRTLRAQFNLAMALKGSGHTEEAFITLGEIRRLNEIHFSPVSPLGVRAVVQQATLLAERGEPTRALVLLNELEPQLSKLPEEDARRAFWADARRQLLESSCVPPQPHSGRKAGDQECLADTAPATPRA